MIILAIETSCDETAVAILNENKLVSNIVYSQSSIHESFGGVVPELASRAHLQTIIPTVDEALKLAGIKKKQIDAIVVTYGPGLIGALLVGVNVAKTMAYANDIPILGVNHLEGHIFANQLDHPNLKPPMITLLISGGHSILIFVEEWGKYRIVGKTLDDAAGEAFDKVAKMLSLGYPGGPIIDHMAKDGNSDFVKFPRALMKKNDQNFSFSGLKTAVLNYINSKQKSYIREHVADICASFQKAVSDVLIHKTIHSAEKFNVKKITLAGGVARNEFLRNEFQNSARANNVDVYFPSPEFCTDNAAMIGCAGYFHLKNGRISSFSLDAIPNLKLDSIN